MGTTRDRLMANNFGSPPVNQHPASDLLQEDGSFLLQEDGTSSILQET